MYRIQTLKKCLRSEVTLLKIICGAQFETFWNKMIWYSDKSSISNDLRNVSEVLVLRQFEIMKNYLVVKQIFKQSNGQINSIFTLPAKRIWGFVLAAEHFVASAWAGRTWAASTSPTSSGRPGCWRSTWCTSSSRSKTWRKGFQNVQNVSEKKTIQQI